MKTEDENRSKHVALARHDCTKCQGTGLASPQETCACVWRQCFRIVLRKVRNIEIGAHLLRPLCLLGASGPQGRSGNGRRLENFSADVYLTAKRTLQHKADWDLFRYHYLLGADWKACCKVLKMDRGNFFHACYRIEAALGRVYATLMPYSLYPLDEYFQVVIGRTADVRAIPVPEARYPNGVPLRPPLAVAAPAPDPFEAVKEEIRVAFSQGQTLTAICNDLNQRGVLPKRASHWYPAILRLITGPRPDASAPEPVPIEPAPAPAPPAPLAPFNIADSACTAHYARKGFRAGRSLSSLAAELTRMKVAAPNGTEWRACDVRHLLLNNPRETARFKRAA